MYLAVFSNDYDILQLLVQNGYTFTTLFFKNDPWKIAGRNSSIQIISFLANIIDLPFLDSTTILNNLNRNNIISTLIKTDCYSAISLMVNNDVSLDTIETFCRKFESISSKITEAKALDVLDNLIQNITNFNKQSTSNGLLHWICMSGSPQVANLLFQSSIPIDLNKINEQNKLGTYYLIGKKTENIISIFEILFKIGYDINFKPADGNSILTDFVLDLNPDLKVIDFMLQNGANPKIATSQNKTLYEIIEESVKNSLFYTQLRNQFNFHIYQLFQKYSIMNEE